MTEPNSNLPPLATLHYETIRPQDGRRLSVRRFFAGLFFGMAVSLTVWLLGYDMAHSARWDEVFLAFLLFLPAGGIVGLCKVIVAIVCCFAKGWRGFGIGILASIALGALLFLGTLLYVHAFGITIHIRS